MASDPNSSWPDILRWLKDPIKLVGLFLLLLSTYWITALARINNGLIIGLIMAVLIVTTVIFLYYSRDLGKREKPIVLVIIYIGIILCIIYSIHKFGINAFDIARKPDSQSSQTSNSDQRKGNPTLPGNSPQPRSDHPQEERSDLPGKKDKTRPQPPSGKIIDSLINTVPAITATIPPLAPAEKMDTVEGTVDKTVISFGKNQPALTYKRKKSVHDNDDAIQQFLTASICFSENGEDCSEEITKGDTTIKFNVPCNFSYNEKKYTLLFYKIDYKQGIPLIKTQKIPYLKLIFKSQK